MAIRNLKNQFVVQIFISKGLTKIVVSGISRCGLL